MMTARWGIALAISLTGCAQLLPRQAVLPDPTIPHRLAEEVKVEVWIRRPDGQLVKERIRMLEGWWCAAPDLVEKP